MLQVRNLSKRYGNRLVLRNIHLDILRGVCLGISGANGAGKSTLLKILAHRSAYDGGSIVYSEQEAPRCDVSWLGHEPGLYLDFSARENLEFFAHLSGNGGTADVEGILTRVGLGRTGQKRVREFSRGMKQRAALGRLLVENRWLWLLDEPTTGLDIHAKELLRDVVDEHRENGGSVVLVTHHRDVMEWLGATCHILKGGILQEVDT